MIIKKTFTNLLVKLKNPTCKIHPTSQISLKAIIGENCKIGANTIIAANVKIGSYVQIGSYVNLRRIEVGDHTMIEGNVKVVGTSKGKIVIGKHCYIGVYDILDTSDNIRIGDYVHIAGPSTALWCHSSVNMCLNSIPLNDKNREEYRPTGPIDISNNVYIGGNSTIYPNINIGSKSVIGPNSVVNKNVDSNTFVAGVPIKIKKQI